MSWEKKSLRCKNLALAFTLAALAALAALPAYAEDSSPSLWDVVVDALCQLVGGDEPEAGLSIEPGG